jgi:hypothetical protein
MPRFPRRLTTVHEVVDELGGLSAVCRLTGANIKQGWNWIGRSETFPASYYVCMQRALQRRGATAPARLWNQKGIKKKKAA